MRIIVLWAVILITSLATGAEDSLKPDQELYLQGARAFDAGEYSSALSSFEQLQRRYAGSALACPTFYALAESYYSMQEYAKAIRQLNQIDDGCMRLVGSGKVLLRKAWTLYQLDRKTEAGRIFSQAARSGELNQEAQRYALVMSGDVSAESGQYEDAISAYTRVVQGSPPLSLATQIYTKIGKTHLRSNNPGAAREAFSRVLQLDASSEFADDAVYGRAWSMRLLKNHNQAAVNWTMLISSYPASPLVPEARFRLGEENYRMEKFPEAMLAFGAVPPSSDFADDAAYWTAWAHYRMGEYARAAYAYDQVRTKFSQSRIAHDARFRAAEAHRDAGEYERALMGYRFIVELGSNTRYFIPSVYGMAQSAAMSGDISAAERYRTQLLSTGRAGDFAPRVFFDLGVAAYNRKQYDIAIREFNALVDRYPNHILIDEALYELGLSYMREEMYAEAKNTLRRCINHAPESEAGRNSAYQLGWAHFRAGEYRNASNQFLSVAGRGYERADDARYRAGDALYNGGEYDEAIGLYQQVIDRNPGTELAATAQNSIGWCFDRLGRMAEAVGAFQVVVDRYPQSRVWDDSAYKVAEYYHSHEDFTLSVAVLEELRATPSSPFWESSLLMLGEGLWQLDRKRDARAALRSLLERQDSPMRQDALLLLGDLSWEEEEWGQARSYYAQFADEFPNHELSPKTLLRVADAYAADMLWAEASRAYSRASVAGAEQLSCLAGRCRASAELGDCGSAEESARTLESRYAADPVTGDAQFWVGNCHYQHENDDAAVRLLLKVPILYADSEYADDALLLVARVRLRQQKPDQAERQLKMLLEKYPASTLRAEAQRLLASMGGAQ